MSYFATDEEDLGGRIRKSNSRRSNSSKGGASNRNKDNDLIEQIRESSSNNLVQKNSSTKGLSSYDDEMDQRHRESKSRRSSKSRSKSREEGRKYRGSSRNKKKSSSRSRSRRESSRRYDEKYGTDYMNVDDGIVGCADDLCVNKNDYLSDEDNDVKLSQQRMAQANASANANGLESPNTGEQNKDVNEEEEVYIVKQRYGYFSIIIGVIQIIVLALMMWQCGIAPMNINPMFGPYPDALSEWGGKNSVLIVEDGEWWRLITPIFLHAGVIHLFCNVAVQLELGVFFEREWGSMTWLIIYLSSALGSSVLSVITMPDAVSVGSSGAVMGLFGGKLSEVICRCCERDDTKQSKVAHQVRKEQCIGVTCSVIVVMAFSFIPYVDWAAHLGGLLAGFFVGFMTFSIHMESYCLRLLWFLVGMGLTLGFLIPCIDIMYSGDIEMNEELRDVCGYYQQNFEDYECNCMREEYLENLKNNYNFFNNDDVNNGGGNEDGGERFLL